jgi:TatD DNase family protein
MGFVDSHNHIQDPRLAGTREEILAACVSAGVTLSALNGTHPNDWAEVATLAKQHSFLVPSFGVHPWFIDNLPANWEDSLRSFITTTSSGIGEIGIDGWRKEFDPAEQERIFLSQLTIAAERNLPVSIHGLRRWGRLLELLRSNPIPDCGFLLHSYGGPEEMIPAFAKLGGYFSCPGFFLSSGREMKLRVFRAVPEERLLIETDAPDQNLPESLDRYRLASSNDTKRVNHPANIVAVYEGVAQLRGTSIEALSALTERNFRRLFAPVLTKRAQASPTSAP